VAFLTKADAPKRVADTIAIAIDQRMLRDCVGPPLARHLPGYNVKVVGWPEDLVELKDWCSISLVVLWISPAARDLETAFEAAIEAATANRPIAVLADSADSKLVARALMCGVRAFLSTSMSVTELANTIRFVAEGGRYMPPSILDTTLHGMTSPQSAFRESNGVRSLSPRQLQVLECLHEGKSNKIIAYELGMAEPTVKVHIRMIMKKLGAHSRTQVVLNTKRERPAGLGRAALTLATTSHPLEGQGEAPAYDSARSAPQRLDHPQYLPQTTATRRRLP
jgi:DNA-binding NarL/FixJ family response regulator